MDFLKNLFKRTQNSKLPLIQEPLVRSEAEDMTYQLWIAQEKHVVHQQFLRNQFEIFLQKQRPDSACVFMKNAHTGGLMYYHREPYATQDFQHFFEFLKQSIVALNYRIYMSDVKQFNRKSFAEKIERHYLKPLYVLDETTQKLDQRYGNIHLELTYHNDKAIQIKLLCHNYHDHKFKTSLNFNDMIYKLL